METITLNRGGRTRSSDPFSIEGKDRGTHRSLKLHLCVASGSGKLFSCWGTRILVQSRLKKALENMLKITLCGKIRL